MHIRHANPDVSVIGYYLLSDNEYQPGFDSHSQYYAMGVKLHRCESKIDVHIYIDVPALHRYKCAINLSVARICLLPSLSTVHSTSLSLRVFPQVT